MELKSIGQTRGQEEDESTEVLGEHDLAEFTDAPSIGSPPRVVLAAYYSELMTLEFLL